MREKLKTACLVFLILSSMLLTYRLWFGRPPLEKGTVPRYEYVYFTPPPPVSEIVQPAEAVYFCREGVHLYRRGDGEYQRLWTLAWQVLTRGADPERIRRNSESDFEAAWEAAASKLVFPFRPALPLEFLNGLQGAGEVKIQKIIFLWAEGTCTVFWEGEEVFSLVFPDTGATDGLMPAKDNICFQLPSRLVFDVDGRILALAEDEDLQGLETEKTPASANLPVQPAVLTNPAVPQPAGNWEIIVPQEIFVERELLAAEITLEKEEIQRDELVKAFFLDLSLARRIEEKDGAVYFTNGEKGLRIYASGLVEYTAPRVEDSFRSQLPYGLSLQRGAESLSLYGGILPDTYLDEVREMKSGCRLIWRRVLNGLILEGENAGCEILLEGQGLSFLRRNFLLAGTEVTARRPFRPFEEALHQAFSLQQERLQKGKATLLSLKPVYYLPADSKGQAIPAWAVNFAETGVIYLHWSTLELL